jgi:sugar (pentulose or hexulose) kinase
MDEEDIGHSLGKSPVRRVSIGHLLAFRASGQALPDGIAATAALAYQSLLDIGAPAMQRVIGISGGARLQAWTAIDRRVHRGQS